MKFICVLIDPKGEEWYDAYGPETKNRKEATRFATAEIAASAANTRFGRAGRAFWECELEAEQRAKKKYRGWTYRTEKA